MTNNGGAAFPSPGVVLEVGVPADQQGAYEGMSLRDYFAIHAPEPSADRVKLNLELDRGRNPYNEPHKAHLRSEYEIRADLRYAYADAMLKARTKEQDP